jgi:peptidylprolyl isomerase
MQRVDNGDFVTVQYVGTIDTGEIFENTDDSGPLEFQVGTGAVLPAFEAAITGMAPGDTKTISIAPQDAYGEKLPELIHTVNKNALGENADPKPGIVFGMTIEHDGKPQQVPAMVTAVEGDMVTVDFNHPLAGKTLTYHITVTTIRDQPTEKGAPPADADGC